MRKSKRQGHAPRPREHRCIDCEKYGGFVPTDATEKLFQRCPRGVIKLEAPAPTMDAAQRAAGEREGE
jgi:hypothetical protein